VIEQAFADGIIMDGHTWFAMLKSRNITSHTYDQEIATDILDMIMTPYIDTFRHFTQTIPTLPLHATR
jgi:nucleotidyltransferase substrate binding protein (TIGR01987 family)